MFNLSFKLSTVLVISTIALSACHVKVGNDDKKDEGGGGAAGATITYATYEMLEGCSTGTKKFNGGNETEVFNLFCEGLKNNEANGNCAQYQRQQAFTSYKCAGTWPHSTVSGYNSSSSQSYSYSENGCSTGFHYISAASAESGKKAYCRTLLDDELNANCARGKREESYNEAGCKAE